MSKLFLKPNPTLADIQQYVRDMEAERGFTDNDIMAKCMLLSEEVGELFKCVRKSHTTLGIDSGKSYEFDSGAEIADILIVLTTIANRLGVDIEQAFRDKEEKNKQRTWR